MMEPIDSYECAGVWVEIIPDTDPSSPQDNDNAGTIYSWTSGWDGDEYIFEPDLEIDCPRCYGEGTIDGSELPTASRYDQRTCPDCQGDRVVVRDLPAYMRRHYDAVLTIPLRFSDYGSRGADLYVSDDPNCAICFTQQELDREWHGSVDDATKYAEARISELDDWFQGNVWGIVIRDREGGEVMESCWGFIGSPDADYIKNEAIAMAEGVAAEIAHEHQLAQEWAARDVMTTTERTTA